MDTSGDLHREFGGEWTISENPGGLEICVAVRQKGRASRTIAARTAGELLEKLRKLRDHDYGNGLPVDEV